VRHTQKSPPGENLGGFFAYGALGWSEAWQGSTNCEQQFGSSGSAARRALKPLRVLAINPLHLL